MEDSEMAESTDCDPEKRRIHRPGSELDVNSCTDHQPISLISDLWIVVSIVIFIADVGSDILACVQHYKQNHLWYFGITLGLAVTASLVLQMFSSKWFYDDGEMSCKNCVFHLLQMGPLQRYWSVIKLCWMSHQGRISAAQELLIPKWRDLCMLRLLQAFIQSAPQAVFQLFVLCHKATFVLQDDLIIAIAAVTSLMAVIWSLVCYSKALRDLRENAQDLPWLGFTFQLSWRACMVTSRVVALVLFASHFKQWVILAAGCHWFIMALWLTCQRTQFCVDEDGREHPCKEKIFNSVIAFIYIFCFFNTKEGMTRKRIVLFYSVMLVENSLLISMWYPNRTLNMTMTYASMSVVWGGFVLGVIFMVLYYRFYHHSHTFRGLFLRARMFSLHGRKMYGLYFCFCCRIRKWDVAIYDCRESNAESSIMMGQDQIHNFQEQNTDQDNPNDVNLHWDNDDIQMRPLNGTCVRGRENNPVKSESIRHSLTRVPTRDEGSDDAVPDIVVTEATPLVLSPRDSVGQLSAEDKEQPSDEEANTIAETPPQSPGQSSLDKAREILASKLNKSSDSPSEEAAFEEENDIPKINYGTVSFGNRYSLVSSDCISISSESSLSSFTSSLNDLLDRMGVAPKIESLKKADTEQKASVGADEGIFSDERESPTKSSEPSPSRTEEAIQMFNGSVDEERIPPFPLQKDDPVNLETMMDASSPYVRKRFPRKDVDKNNAGSESDSTDASGDDRERRHSCEEFFIDFSPTDSPEDEAKSKRHSFDIADLSTNYNRVKKKGKNKRRFNKIIIFDNFVASSLKPGKFGSLRKSFERLSKIQEDTEESGLLSNDSLQSFPEPQSGDQLLLENEANNDNSLSMVQHYSDASVLLDNEIPPNSDHVGATPKPTQSMSAVTPPLSRKMISNSPNSNPIDVLLLVTAREDENINTNTNLNGDIDGIGDSEGDKLSSQEFIKDLTPSRFSTVRRSLDNVPLACCEDFDDLDDLGSSSGDVEINRAKDHDGIPVSISLTKLPCQRNMSTESIAGSESSRDQVNFSANQSLASSGSSIFETFRFLETDQNPSELQKRHTYAFGANRFHNTMRGEKVKRLGSSSSQNNVRTPGGPVWVYKSVINSRRRRKPKGIGKNQNNDTSVSYIQEIRV